MTKTGTLELFDELVERMMGPGASRLYRIDPDPDAAASVTTTAPTGATETTTDPEHSRDQPETTNPNPTKGGNPDAHR